MLHLYSFATTAIEASKVVPVPVVLPVFVVPRRISALPILPVAAADHPPHEFASFSPTLGAAAQLMQ